MPNRARRLQDAQPEGVAPREAAFTGPPGAHLRPILVRRGGADKTVRALAAFFFVAALAFAAYGWATGDTFYLRLATEALILGGMAMSVDILLGFTGLLSLGQALYFGIGAYTSALALKSIAASFWLALAASIGVATVAGLIGGFIALRARGVYFALITFGLAQVAARIVYNTRELGASDGIIGIPITPVNLGVASVASNNAVGFFLVVLAVMAAMYGGLSYLMATPFGRALQAIRVNEKRVSFLGYAPRRIKLAAFVLAANVAAIAGALYPMLRGFVSPELMFFDASGNAVIIAIVGGTGTLIGPLYGSVIITGLRSVIGTWTEHHLIVIGILFMLAVIFMPRGLVGLIRRLAGGRGDGA